MFDDLQHLTLPFAAHTGCVQFSIRRQPVSRLAVTGRADDHQIGLAARVRSQLRVGASDALNMFCQVALSPNDTAFLIGFSEDGRDTAAVRRDEISRLW